MGSFFGLRKFLYERLLRSAFVFLDGLPFL